VAEIPLLFETKRETEFDWIVVTICEPNTQKKRLMERHAFNADDAQKRIAAQLPMSVKSDRANAVIRTDGSFEDTERQFDATCDTLKQRY
jgi:dephospho-CoA kinase